MINSSRVNLIVNALLIGCDPVLLKHLKAVQRNGKPLSHGFYEAFLKGPVSVEILIRLYPLLLALAEEVFGNALLIPFVLFDVCADLPFFPLRNGAYGIIAGMGK